MGSISLQLLPSPAGFVPGAPHGVTQSFPGWPAGTGSGSAFRKGTGFFSGCGLCCAAGGFGPGCFCFSPCYSGCKAPGQRARAEVILRQQALSAGEFVSEEKLTAGEYALLQSGEFSWASLNFSKGRLIVEAAAAKPVPDIASGTLHGITARVAGTVLETNLTSGTMLVTPGQAVEAGQGLIGTARMERDGTLIFQPAAGRVLAQFEWEFSETLPTTVAADQLTGSKSHQYQLHFAGKSLALPPWSSHQENARAITRHLHPAFWGLALPCSVEETVFYHTQNETLSYTGDQLLALARLHSRQVLYAAYPDAVLLTRKEDFSAEGDQFHYRVCYTIAADICQENTKTAED